MYTESERQNTLDKVCSLIIEIPYVEGLIVVGSGANGFKDVWSDIDLCVVCNDNETKSTWEKLTAIVLGNFKIQRHQLNEYGDSNYLTIFLLENWLQIDMGVISLENLVAKRKLWNVVYDKTGLVKKKMEGTWNAQKKSIDKETVVKDSLDSVWYYLQNAVNSFNRGRQLRLYHELSELRERSSSLLGDMYELDMKHFRDVDSLNSKILTSIKETYPTSFDRKELARAVVGSCSLYFSTIKLFGVMIHEIEELESSVKKYLSETVC